MSINNKKFIVFSKYPNLVDIVINFELFVNFFSEMGFKFC